jgi:hypothetical protein
VTASPAPGRGEIGYKAEVIAGPDAVDRLAEDSSASGYVQSLASLRPKTQEDGVD